jgi:TPR repeat protein
MLNRRYADLLAQIKTWTPETAPAIAQAMWALAEQGQPDALYFAAYWCINPTAGIVMDIEKAKTLMIRSMQRGCALAEARCYQEGWGVIKDKSRAVRILLTLEKAEPDHPRVLGGLGFVFNNGEGVAQNRTLGSKYLQRAQAVMDPTSIYNLGLERSGDRLDRRLLQQAVDFGYGQAAVILCGNFRDISVADMRRMLAKAAAVRIPRAQELLDLLPSV